MGFELNRIEVHTIVYMGKEMNSYLKKMDRNEEDEDEDRDPYDKLIKESLYGQRQEEQVELPRGFKGRVRLDPRDIEMENETFSLEQTQSQFPVFDNVELILKSGETIIITESMDEYLAIREAYFTWEKAILQMEKMQEQENPWSSIRHGDIPFIPFNLHTNGDSSTEHTEGI